MCYHNPHGKYFDIELKSIVAQHENLAANGILGVRVSLIFLLISFEQKLPHNFFTDPYFDIF